MASASDCPIFGCSLPAALRAVFRLATSSFTRCGFAGLLGSAFTLPSAGKQPLPSLPCSGKALAPPAGFFSLPCRPCPGQQVFSSWRHRPSSWSRGAVSASLNASTEILGEIRSQPQARGQPKVPKTVPVTTSPREQLLRGFRVLGVQGLVGASDLESCCFVASGFLG